MVLVWVLLKLEVILFIIGVSKFFYFDDFIDVCKIEFLDDYVKKFEEFY